MDEKRNISHANQRQVGGSHYAGRFQHWDFVHAAGLGYFEGQITKYLSRHAKKHGRQDVEKALHFTQKLHELALSGRTAHHGQPPSTMINQFVMDAGCPGGLEHSIIGIVSTWRTPGDLGIAVTLLDHALTVLYPPAPAPATDGSEPTVGYVNQDYWQRRWQRGAPRRLLDEQTDD